jgi:hypothetical protein
MDGLKAGEAAQGTRTMKSDRQREVNPALGLHLARGERVQPRRGLGFYFRALEELRVFFGDNFTTLRLRQM